MAKYTHICAAAMLALLIGLTPSSALADRRGGRGGGHDGYRGGHWGGDIHRFHDRDYHYWQGGHWRHAWHDGAFGWWWTVGDLFYRYPAPIYPYPDPYTPPVIIIQGAQQQEAPPLAPAAPPQAPMWYYCDRPAGYYPYVPECPSGWRAVPASPPSAPVAPAAPQAPYR